MFIFNKIENKKTLSVTIFVDVVLIINVVIVIAAILLAILVCNKTQYILIYRVRQTQMDNHARLVLNMSM